MPTYNAHLNALDVLIRENNGTIPDLTTPFTKSIVGRADKPHTGLTVGDVLKGAFEELSAIRPNYDDVRVLEQFYNPNAPTGLHKPLKDYIDRLKSVATTS
jgi:hypothetical protein